MRNGVVQDRERDGRVLQHGYQRPVLPDVALEQVAHALHRANEGHQAILGPVWAGIRLALASTSVRARTKLLSRSERVVGGHAATAKPWTMNAVHDIDALSMAVPYCHVVVPDREMASLLSRSGTGSHYGTKIVTTLSELPDILPELAEQARNAPGGPDRLGLGRRMGRLLSRLERPVQERPGQAVRTVTLKRQRHDHSSGRHVGVQLELPAMIAIPADMLPDLRFQCSLVRVVCHC